MPFSSGTRRAPHGPDRVAPSGVREGDRVGDGQLKDDLVQDRQAAPVTSKPAHAVAHSCRSSLDFESDNRAAAFTAEAPECSTLNAYRDVLAARLDHLSARANLQHTGIRLHVLWHTLHQFPPTDVGLVLCPMADHRISLHGCVSERCEECLRRYWSRGGRGAGRERAFSGACGAISYWASLFVADARILTLVLQAPPSGSVVARDPAEQAPRPVRPGRRPCVSEHTAAINGGVALIKVTLHDLEATVRANLLSRKLTTLQCALRNFEVENARLRHAMHLRAPGIPEHVPPIGVQSHAQQTVHRVLDYIHAHYHCPLQLSDLAAAVRMNGSYLSDVFSRTMGVTLHEYLLELRLTKAKGLLCDPSCRVREVARAAGYTTDRAFRNAFKKGTGLSPVDWRARQAVTTTRR